MIVDEPLIIPGDPSNNISVRQNNPFNLKHVGQAGSTGAGTNGFATFRSPEEGVAAGIRQLQLDQSRGLTFGAFAEKYAPAYENPTWAKDVSGALGIDSDTPIAQVPTEDLARAVAKRESSTVLPVGIMGRLLGLLGPSPADAADLNSVARGEARSTWMNWVAAQQQHAAEGGVAIPVQPPDPALSPEDQTAQALVTAKEHLPWWSTSDVIRQLIVGGPERAGKNWLNTLLDASTWLNQGGMMSALANPGSQSDANPAAAATAAGEGAKAGIPTPDAATSVAGELAGGLSQFLTSVLGLRGLGLPAPAGAWGRIGEGALAGDLAFSPTESRVSSAIEPLAAAAREKAGAIAGNIGQNSDPILGWIAQKAGDLPLAAVQAIAGFLKPHQDDTTAMAHLRNILEQAGLGAIVEPIMGMMPAVGRLFRADVAEETIATTASTVGKVFSAADRTKFDFLHPFTDADIEGVLGHSVPPEYLAKLRETGNLCPGVRLGAIGTPAEADEMVVKFGSYFQNVFDEAGGGTRTWAEADRQAQLRSLEDLAGAPMSRILTDVELRGYTAAFNGYKAEAERVLPAMRAGDPAAKATFQEAMATMQALTMQMRGSAAEAGRSLNMIKNTLSPARMAMETLAAGEAAASELQQTLDNSTGWEHLKAVANLTFTKLGHIWYAGLLSNPATHAANIVSTNGFLAYRIPEAYIEAVVSHIPVVGSGEIPFAAVNAYTQTMVSSFGDALRGAFAAARTGESAFNLSKVEISRAPLPDLTQYLPPGLKWFGRGVDTLGKAANLVTNSLMAEDEFAKIATQRAAAEYYGRLKLGGAPLSDGMIEQMANQYAGYITFNDPGGRLIRAATDIVHTLPPLLLFAPFIRTPGNLFSIGMERFPVTAMFMRDVWRDMNAGGYARDQALGKLALGTGMFMLGWHLAASGFTKGAGPADPGQHNAWLSGGQNVPDSIQFEPGGTPYTFNRIDPLASMLSTAANLHQLYHTNLGSGRANEDLVQLLGQAIITTTFSLTSKTYARGMADIMDGLMRQDPTGHRFGKLERTIEQSLLPFSGIMGGIKNVIDPLTRDTRTADSRGEDSMVQFANYARERIPLLSQTLEPRVDTFGREIQPWKRPWWGMLLPTSIGNDISTPIEHEIARLKMPIDMPSRFIGGGATGQAPGSAPDTTQRVAGVELTNKEYNEMVKLQNQPAPGIPSLLDTLNSLIETPQYKGATDFPQLTGLSKAAQIEAHIRIYRDAGQKAFLIQHPEILQQIMGQTERRMQLQLPGNSQ